VAIIIASLIHTKEVRALLLFLALAGWQPKEGQKLIGTRAPEWRSLEWIQGGPLTLGALHGKVVLIRFWAMGCSLCATTAPELQELSDKYGERGLVVIGIHHPKSPDAHDRKKAAQVARELGMRFPIAHDEDWKTLRAYGFGTHFQNYTSISILIDRDGVIRFVHDGGEFHRGGGADHRECNAAYEAVVQAIEKALGRPSK